ncbi:MAG: hydrogenase maturation nickel metallochaperone HypA [Magnetococcales bacterium]|nr:hydrogenase maturation nickel metallochaperone HypA [Magnetococcales bacterium]
MHELAIALSLVDQLRRIAEREHATRITCVRIRVGPTSGVDGEALAFCFPMAAREYPSLEATQLQITTEPLQWLCLTCHKLFSEPSSEPVCPYCGALEHHLTGSDELTLESVELT